MTRDEQTAEDLTTGAGSNGCLGVLRTGCLWYFGLLVVFALYAAGQILLGDSISDFRLWMGRPHVTVEAGLTDVESWLDRNSESGYCYRGEYHWRHQGSEGTILRNKRYEQTGLVPDSVDVTLYLGADDRWHPLGENGGGLLDFAFYLVAGVAVMAVAALVAFLVLRSIVRKAMKVLSKRTPDAGDAR